VTKLLFVFNFGATVALHNKGLTGKRLQQAFCGARSNFAFKSHAKRFSFLFGVGFEKIMTNEAK
jgi:hypothetical protein